MTEPMKGVSVYIPFKDSHESLEQVLTALANQDCPITQLILIDDGSALPATRNLAPGFSNVQIIRHEKNLGVAAARNTALKVCQCDLIASFDADIVPDRRCLSHLVAALEEDSSLTGAGGRVTERYCDDTGDLFRAHYMKQDRGEKEIEQADLFGGCTIYRTQALIAVGGYTEMLRNSYEDFDISRRVHKNGGRTRYLPAARAEHIKRDTVRSALDTLYRWSYPHWESDKSLAEHRWYEQRIQYPELYYERAVAASIDTLIYKMRGDLLLALGRLRDCMVDRIFIANLIYPVRAVLRDLIYYRQCGGAYNEDASSLLIEVAAFVLESQMPRSLGVIIFQECRDLFAQLFGGEIDWEELVAFRSSAYDHSGERWPSLLSVKPAALPAQTFIEVYSEMLRILSNRDGSMARALEVWPSAA